MTDHWGTVLESASCDKAWYGMYAGWYFFCQQGEPAGDSSQKDYVLGRQAMTYTKDHAGDLPLVMAKRVGRLWDAYKPRQTIYLNATWEGRTWDASIAAFWSYWTLLPLGIAGLVILRRRRVPITPIVAPAIVVSIAAATTYGVLRYRVSVEPGLVIVAAVTIDAIWTRFRPATPKPDPTTVTQRETVA